MLTIYVEDASSKCEYEVGRRGLGKRGCLGPGWHLSISHEELCLSLSSFFSWLSTSLGGLQGGAIPPNSPE